MDKNIYSSITDKKRIKIYKKGAAKPFREAIILKEPPFKPLYSINIFT
jgi:hypothetical protein